jgi:hypothetical protein
MSIVKHTVRMAQLLRRDRLRQVTTLLLLVLALAPQLGAQRAATVPPTSGVYERLESVAARFPARGVHLAHRPLSRTAVSRIIARLTEAIDRDSTAEAVHSQWAREQIALVSAAIGADRGAAVAWRFEEFGSDAPTAMIEPNGLGLLDARTQSFAAGREGAPWERGIVTRFVPTGFVGLDDRFAFLVEPETFIAASNDAGSSLDAHMRRYYARGVFKNVVLQLGADDRRWGQSPAGALFVSGHASPLPALALSFDTAFTLPWWFRLAGPVQGTIFVADLGATQTPPHAKLAGWQASIQPWSRVELGVIVLAHTGGSGGPKATFAQRVVDLFPVIDALAPQHSDLQISNKLAGGNLLVRIPELSGLALYYELQIDDFDGRRLRSSLGEDSGHLLGLRLPLALASGELVWRAEWHRTSLRLYEHAQFTSGVTYQRRLIGSPLGPNAGAGYLSATWQRTPLQAFSLSLADERRNPSLYATVTTSPTDADFHFVRLTHDPNHRRARIVGSVRDSWGDRAVEFTAGYNRAWREKAAGRNEWMAALTIGSALLRDF